VIPCIQSVALDWYSVWLVKGWRAV